MNTEDFDNLPDEMLNARRWLVWKSVPNNDPNKKPRKVPFYVNGSTRTGVLESDDDLKNLANFQAAMRALETGKYTGLGFAFGEDKETGCYFQGVDIDKISEHPELLSVVDGLPGYVEKSPSGDGFHAIGYGKRFDALASNKSGIEAYSFGRYFTVTGQSVSGYRLHDLSEIVEKKLKPIHSLSAHSSSSTNYLIDYEKISIEDIRKIRSALNCFTADDRDRWIRYGQALCKLGNVGRSLWMDWSQQSDKHDPVGDAKTWDSFRGDNTGFPAILKDAYAFGWDGNKKRVESILEPVNDALWLSADELADSAEAPNYLINNIIESKTHGLIAGSSQSFKSFVVLKMAHCICTGLDFFGHEVFDTGKVLYICGEGRGALARRIKALKIVEGGFLDNFRILNRGLPIDNIAEMDWLSKQIADIKPILVIYDTFSSLATSTKENANEEVARALKMVADCSGEHGASSLVVHHYGKGVDNGPRGASAFGANIDFEISMTRPDVAGLNALMSCRKSKDGDLFEEIEILAHVVDLGLIRQDGKTTSSLILKRADIGGGLTSRQSRVMSSLRACIDDEGIFLNGVNGVTEKQVKKSLVEEFKDVKNPWKIYNDVFLKLVGSGHIFTNNEVFWL